MGNVNFEDLLKDSYSRLSSAQKKVADYIFQNLQKSAFNTAVQISQEVGVSDTSVIRLSYSLGFSSFSEMQHAIQKHVLGNNNKTTAGEEQLANSDPFRKIIGEELGVINKLARRINIQDIERAADILLKADQVLVMGYFNAYTAASEIFLRLNMLRPNVHFYRTTETESQRLFNLTENSVVIAVSLPKHIRDTLSFIKQAKKLGAAVIAITENELNPHSHVADISFMVDINADKKTGFLSLSPVLLLVYLIMQGVMIKAGPDVQKHLENVVDHLIEQDIYL